MKSLNLANTIAEYNELKSNYDSINPYVCYVQSEQLTMYDGVPSTWLIRYTSSDGNIVNTSTSKFDNVNIVDNIYRDGEGIIVFDGDVTSIGEGAFNYCRSLASVTIPNSVTSIGNYAFSTCSSLTSITIGNSVTSIENDAFFNCSSLTSIEIPNSVTSIGVAAFEYCSSLTSVVMSSIVPPSLGSRVFSSTSSNLIIYVPDESVDAYKTAANWSSYASKIKPISEKPV